MTWKATCNYCGHEWHISPKDSKTCPRCSSGERELRVKKQESSNVFGYDKPFVIETYDPSKPLTLKDI
jgi:ssDNA-binding Zn-finger/Zn-ribbon topoisomerase 1